MSCRITFLSHSSTSATNAASFAADEPLDARGTAWAREARGLVPRASRARSSPARSCRQTAQALELAADIDPVLADWDLGRWSGRTLDEVVAAEPQAVQAWTGDPAAAPHGGEQLTGLLARAARWLDTVPTEGHTVAVTHAAVVRAAVVGVLRAPPEAFWRIEIAPLTTTQLVGRPGRWTLRSTGVHLRLRTG